MDDDDLTFSDIMDDLYGPNHQPGDKYYRHEGHPGQVVRDRTPPPKSGAVMTTRDAAVEKLREALQSFSAIEQLLGRFKGQEPPVGTVLRWVKEYDNANRELVLEPGASFLDAAERLSFKVTAQQYVFVGFRAPDNRWYVTGARNKGVYDWDALLKEIGDSRCELASGWTDVPAPEKVAEEALDPVAWAKSMFGTKDNAKDVDAES